MAKHRVAAVSGANRGIGLEIGRQLLEKGVSVALGCRDDAKGRKAAESLQGAAERSGAQVASFALDVASEASVVKFRDAVLDHYGTVDILVNNAGVMPEPRDGSLLDTTAAMFRQVLDVNVVGAAMLCQAFVPTMKMRGYGRIVNLSSGLGQLERMGAGLPAYRVSKAAINALTRTLAAELVDTGILVNAVSPGWVKTDMGGPNAERPVEEGAETAVWLCLLPSTASSGGFFRDRKAIPW